MTSHKNYFGFVLILFFTLIFSEVSGTGVLAPMPVEKYHQLCAAVVIVAVPASGPVIAGVAAAAAKTVVAAGVALGCAYTFIAGWWGSSKKESKKCSRCSSCRKKTKSVSGGGNPRCLCGCGCDNGACGCSCGCGCNRFYQRNKQHDHQATKREKVLPRVATYEQARNLALEIIGEVDHTTSQAHIGTVGIGEGLIVGRRWYGKKVVMRLDWDPVKGPHINVDDYRLGKGSKGTSVAIPFEGDLETVQSLLSCLNK